MQLIGSMGLIEDVDYTRQDKSSLSDDKRPDFTFKLPDKKVVNLDVEFPWANYAKYLESEGDDEEQRVRVKKDFYRDVRNHINAVHERGYANPQGGTVDFALIYIPNEGIFRAMLLDGENQVFEEAMKKKIVLCSPITLYAILSMIRQAVENFNLSEKAGEIQKHFLEFRKQWDNYSGKVEALGRDLRLAQGKYDEIVGVRERQLMKPVDNILTTNVETLEDRTSGLGEKLGVDFPWSLVEVAKEGGAEPTVQFELLGPVPVAAVSLAQPIELEVVSGKRTG